MPLEGEGKGEIVLTIGWGGAQETGEGQDSVGWGKGKGMGEEGGISCGGGKRQVMAVSKGVIHRY